MWIVIRPGLEGPGHSDLIGTWKAMVATHRQVMAAHFCSPLALKTL